jgi:fused signal recognition particle receptor
VDTNRWRQTLARTRRSTLGRLASILGASELSPSFWNQLEEILVLADLGISTVQPLIENLKHTARSEGMTSGGQIRHQLYAQLTEGLTPASEPEITTRPFVVILIGVNGSGKTTTAARLAKRWQNRGHSVMLVAADTYRAAAAEQLMIWGERLNVDVIAGKPGSDPGAVVFDACQASLARGTDILIVDTSGRMHTQHNLMAEMQKICRVAEKVIPDAPHQVLLVLDATTGQNGLSQAKSFAEAVDVTGVVLAKLDSSAKGGVGFAIASVLNLPIQYVGIGEGLEDMALFDPTAFVEGLMAESTPLHQPG